MASKRSWWERAADTLVTEYECDDGTRLLFAPGLCALSHLGPWVDVVVVNEPRCTEDADRHDGELFAEGPAAVHRRFADA